jgi:N-acetylglucosaminyldiphosphoundecaprenol N-acetyl-beta-D-mannosaminyltransferase
MLGLEEQHSILRQTAQRAIAPPAMPVVSVLGLDVHRARLSEAVEHIVSSLGQGIGGWVMTPNVDILRRWVNSDEFRQLTSEVSLCVADGMPLVWASRIAGARFPERVTGADLSRALIAAAAGRFSTFFLGGAPGAADMAVRKMQKAHPELEIVGTHCPPYGFEDDPAEWDEMSSMLAAARPDVVFVGLGSPKQEKVIRRLRELAPSAWWLGVGITFSFLGEQIPRAPRWMQTTGLEWLHRLGCEPKRLAKRYLIEDLPFAAWMLARAARGKLHAAPHSGTAVVASQTDGAASDLVDNEESP